MLDELEELLKLDAGSGWRDRDLHPISLMGEEPLCGLGEAIKRIHNNSSVNSLFEFKGGRTS